MTDGPAPEHEWCRPPRHRHHGLGHRWRTRVVAGTIIAGGTVLGWAVPHWEPHLPRVGLDYQASTAQATLAAIAGAMITLSGFIVTAITVVAQTVQGMSPRLVGALRHVGRYTAAFALLVGTALYALTALSQINSERIPRTTVTLAVAFVLLDAVALPYLLGSLREAVTGGGPAPGRDRRAAPSRHRAGIRRAPHGTDGVPCGCAHRAPARDRGLRRLRYRGSRSGRSHPGSMIRPRPCRLSTRSRTA
ncbi:DUF2254 family protein [Parafrankia elaeagni]|uniref:DUF2254 family protein n=1 Tax=Parafrankia elaeagni TaxID=222534 RepID=UPI000374E311|nr:DUF2254 family protein [Parafrankia elaeagni]